MHFFFFHRLWIESKISTIDVKFNSSSELSVTNDDDGETGRQFFFLSYHPAAESWEFLLLFLLKMFSFQIN